MKTKNAFQDQLSLNARQNYCRMLQGEPAILSTFIELPFVIKIFVLFIFEWPLYTGLTVNKSATSIFCFPASGDCIYHTIWTPLLMVFLFMCRSSSVDRGSKSPMKNHKNIGAMTCDFQQCGILT